MANPTADVGTGITLTFATSSFSCEILAVTPPGATREALDSSHQSTTTYKTFEPSSLTDWGSLEFDFNFNPAKTPPVAATAETITISYPADAAWDFSGFMTAYQPGATFENVMQGHAVVKVTGAVDIDASS